MRQKFGKFRSALAMLREFELRAEQLRTRVDEGCAIVLHQIRRRQFAVPLRQFGFVVEQLQMTWSAGHEEEDHAFGLAGKMGLLGRERVRARDRRRPTVLAK